MHVWDSHWRGKNLLRRGWVGDVHDDEPRRGSAGGIDAQKRVQTAVDALHLRCVHARIGKRRRVTRDELRLGRIREIVDHDRAGRELGRDDQ